MERFKKTFDINYFILDKNQEATPLGIINMLQDTAIYHSEAVGLGLEKLKADGIVWILNRWSVEIDKPLKWNTRVSVETWPSGFNRFYATREFIIRDMEGNILLRASSRWILLNIEKKRPVRVPVEFYDLYGMELGDRAVLTEFDDLRRPQGAAGEEVNETGDGNISSQIFKIRRSDLDTNLHVNNARYVEWMIETIPDEIYDNYTLKSLEVSYIKEAQSGMVECIAEKTFSDFMLYSENTSTGGLTRASTCWTGSHLVRLYDGTTECDLAVARTVWHPNMKTIHHLLQ